MIEFIGKDRGSFQTCRQKFQVVLGIDSPRVFVGCKPGELGKGILSGETDALGFGVGSYFIQLGGIEHRIL